MTHVRAEAGKSIKIAVASYNKVRQERAAAQGDVLCDSIFS